MSVDQRVNFDLDDLPMDIFELANQVPAVESLTAGHGMTEMAASCFCICSSSS